MKSSKLLEKSKEYLWDGNKGILPPNDKAQTICFAIRLAEKNKSQNILGFKLRSYIGKALNNSFTVEEWLENKGIDIESIDKYVIQDYRKRWVDIMIEYFKQKGD